MSDSSPVFKVASLNLPHDLNGLFLVVSSGFQCFKIASHYHHLDTIFWSHSSTTAACLHIRSVLHGHIMIMDNIETIAALGLESKHKFRLLRSSSQTSFTDKCPEPNTESSVCYLDDQFSDERCTSAESVVVPCNESHCLSSSSDTLTDDNIAKKNKYFATISKSGSLESGGSLSPLAAAGNDDTFYLHSIITSLSTEQDTLSRGKCHCE